MTDIVERLRVHARPVNIDHHGASDAAMLEAAAEIERLRAENERLSNITHEVRDNPEKIWLEPGCSPERCWSETRLDDCEEHGCGAKAVAYVREDIVDTLRSVSNYLGEQLAMMIDNAGNVANLRADNARLRAALAESADELDAYYRMEYPGDHPYNKAKLAQALASNPARAALKETSDG